MSRFRPAIVGITMVAIAVAGILFVGGVSALTATPTTTSLPSAKQTLLDQEQAARAAGATAAAQKPAVDVSGSPEPIPPRVGGLIQGIKQGPFPPTRFQNNDFWQGPVGTIWIQVYAGADVSGPTPIGELLLYSMPIDPNDGPDILNSVGAFLPPKPESALSIASVNGTILSLVAPSGDRFTFDASSHAWK